MNFTLLAPEILLTILAFVIILMGLLVNNKTKNMFGYLSAAGLLACIVYVLGNGMTDKTSYFYDSLVVDPLSQIFKLIFVIVSLIVVIASIEYFIIGSLSSALMLFGMSLVYGMTGTTNIPAIIDYFNVTHLSAESSLGILAM